MEPAPLHEAPGVAPVAGFHIATTCISASQAGEADRVLASLVTRSYVVARSITPSTTTPTTSLSTLARRTPEFDSLVAVVAGTSSPLAGGDKSHYGPIRYRHIDDIQRNAWIVDLEEEFAKEEALLVKMEELSCYHEASG